MVYVWVNIVQRGIIIYHQFVWVRVRVGTPLVRCLFNKISDPTVGWSPASEKSDSKPRGFKEEHVHGLKAPCTRHYYNEGRFSRSIGTNFVQWILIQIYTYWTDFAHLKKLHRSLGTDVPYTQNLPYLVLSYFLWETFREDLSTNLNISE